MHPRVARKRYLQNLWWLIFVGLSSTTLLFHAVWLEPSRWLAAGVGHFFAIVGWSIICWIIAKRYETIGAMLFIYGLIPALTYSTGLNTTILNAMNIQPATRIALTAPLELMLGVLGGIPGALTGLILIALCFWGTPSDQAILTGHQLVMFGIFGSFTHFLLRALERHHDNLELASLTDSSSGFRNRRALDLDWDSNTTGSFALWDLDGLKRINDSQGHIAGDAHLKAFYQALKNNISPPANIYRIGGDEFISIHPTITNLEPVIHTIRLEFNHVSVGWIQLERHSLDAALNESDVSMYLNKNQRKLQLQP